MYWNNDGFFPITRNCFRSIHKHVHKSLVLSVLLYNSETWMLTAESSKTKGILNEQHSKTRYCSISKKEHQRNKDIRKQLRVEQTAINIIQKRRPRFFRHSCINITQNNGYKALLWTRCKGSHKTYTRPH